MVCSVVGVAWTVLDAGGDDNDVDCDGSVAVVTEPDAAALHPATRREVETTSAPKARERLIMREGIASGRHARRRA